MKILSVLIIGLVVLPFAQARDKGHEDWIPIQSMSQGISRPVVYEQVKATKSKRFTPTAAKATGKIDPAMIAMVKKASVLVDEILRTQGKIDPKDETLYESQMVSLVQAMDRAAAQNYANLGGGFDSESPAACMMECDDAYPGLGGGNGWNRFWCKGACIKIQVGNTGVGGD